MGLQTSASYRSYFDPDASFLQREKALNTHYANNDSLLLIINSNTSLLSQDSLQQLDNLIQELVTLPDVKKIDSIISLLERLEPTDLAYTSAQQQASIDDFDLNDDFESSEENLISKADLLQQLRRHPRAKHFISSDGQSILLQLQVAFSDSPSAKQILTFNQTVSAIAKNFQQSNNTIESINLGGIQALNHAYISVVRNDLETFIPALLGIFFIGLFYFFRQAKLVVGLLFTALLSATSAYGILGFFSVKLSAINAFAPIIIISLGLANASHITTSFIRYRGLNFSPDNSIKNALKENFSAVLLSNLTTAAGFLLLYFSPSPPIRLVGIAVAIGIFFNYLSSQILLPRILISTTRKLSNQVLKKQSTHWRFISLIKILFKFPKTIIVISTLLGTVSLLQLTQLKIDDNVYQYFPKTHEFSRSNQLIESKFSSISRLYFSIDSLENYAIFEADYLEFIQSFSQWLKAQPEVLTVDNIQQLANYQQKSLKQLKQIAKQVTPKNLGVSEEISENFRHSKLTVYLKSTSAKNILEFEHRSQQWLSANTTPYTVTGGVSPDLIFAELGKNNTYSLLYSLTAALILTALLIGFIFKSYFFSFVGLICNLMPITLVYSLWTLFDGVISLGSSVVLGMITGIVIDDTIHFLLKYRKFDVSKKAAVRQTFNQVSPAIVITSLVLTTGFLVGLTSQFRPIMELSGLSAAVILIAMVVDLVLLPAILLKKATNSQHLMETQS